MEPDDPIQLSCLSCPEPFETTYAEWKSKAGRLECSHCHKVNDYGQSDMIAAAGKNENPN